MNSPNEVAAKDRVSPIVLLCLVALTVWTLAGSVSTADGASDLAIMQLQFGEAVHGPLTLRTTVQLGEEPTMPGHGVWLAGIATEPQGQPTALAVTLSEVDNAWFGPLWGIQLQSDVGLIPQHLAPTKGTGFLSGSEHITLQNAALNWSHEYEVILAYDPTTGATAVSIYDNTADQLLLMRTLQLQSLPSTLYPGAGVGMVGRSSDAGADLPIAFVQPVHLVPAIVPVLTWPQTWSLMQRDHHDTPFRVTQQLNRTKETVLVLSPAGMTVQGRLDFALLDANDQAVVTIKDAVWQTPIPVAIDGLRPGTYRGQLRYVEGENDWLLDERDIVVGSLSVEADDLRVMRTSANELTVEGTLRFASDGSINAVIVSLSADLIEQRFAFRPEAVRGTIEETNHGRVTIMQPHELRFSGTIPVNLDFAATIPLPGEGETGAVWELRLDTEVSPDELMSSESGTSAWLGEPVRSFPWRGFLRDERNEVRTELAPGIELVELRGDLPAGAVDVYVVLADVTRPGVMIDSLLPATRFSLPRTRWPRSVMSRMVEETGAVAGVNANYFLINSTQLPLGTIVHSGEVLATGTREVVAFTEDGTPYLGSWAWEGRLHHPTGTTYRTVSGMNEPHPGEKISLHRWPATRSPGTGEFGSDVRVVELVVEEKERGEHPVQAGFRRISGVVREVREDQPAAPISLGEFVLGATNVEAQYLLDTYNVGDEISLDYRLHGAAEWPYLNDWQHIDVAASGGIVLLRNGHYASEQVAIDPDRRPRTAIGMSWDQTQVIFVLVDGRSSSSVGMTYRELADFLRYMGAFHALNLDGGGSSTVAVRDPVTHDVVVVNVPSDGNERPVVDGIGLFYVANHE